MNEIIILPSLITKKVKRYLVISKKQKETNSYAVRHDVLKDIWTCSCPNIKICHCKHIRACKDETKKNKPDFKCRIY
jgi:hypothetical protein